MDDCSALVGILSTAAVGSYSCRISVNAFEIVLRKTLSEIMKLLNCESSRKWLRQFSQSRFEFSHGVLGFWGFGVLGFWGWKVQGATGAEVPG